MADYISPEVSVLVTPRSTWFWFITTIWSATLIIGWSTSLLWLSFQVSGIQPAPIMDLLLFAWLLFSVRRFSNLEYGSVYFFGRPQFIVAGGGPKIIPLGLFTIYRDSTQTMEVEYPGEPEEIQKTDDSVPLGTVKVRVGKDTIIEVPAVRPVRIVTKKPDETSDQDDPLSVQLGMEMSWWLRFRITDPLLFRLQLHNVEGAVRQLRDISERGLTGFVTTRTAQQLTSEFKALNEDFKVYLEEEVKELGIEIPQMGINPPDYGHTMASAIERIGMKRAEVQEAKSQKEITETNANAAAYATTTAAQAEAAAKLAVGTAEADVITLKGKAEGQAEEERRAGRGRGIGRLARSVKVAPEVVLQAEVAENTIGKGSVVVGNDMTAIGKAVGTGKALLDSLTSERSNGQ